MKSVTVLEPSVAPQISTDFDTPVPCKCQNLVSLSYTAISLVYVLASPAILILRLTPIAPCFLADRTSPATQ